MDVNVILTISMMELIKLIVLNVIVTVKNANKFLLNVPNVTMGFS